MEIVGIVGDTTQAFEAAVQPTLFVPYEQFPIDVLAGMYRNLSIVLKTAGDPIAVASGLRAAMQDIDRDQPLVRVRTMEEAMSESVAQPRLRTALLAMFSLVALALSLIGVYGVMAYVVGQRLNEIGLRMALGASQGDVLGMVLKQGLALTGAGVVLGFVSVRIIGKYVGEIHQMGALVFFASAFVILAAAIIASAVPAARAARVNAVEALRTE